MLIEGFCNRLLISRLEEVDPRILNQDEKLAFWINIHNALVMHVMAFTSVFFTMLNPPNFYKLGLNGSMFPARHFWLMGFHKTM